jgi:hypothetical protein
VSWYAACFLKKRVREERIRSRSDEEAPVKLSRQHRFRTRLVSMCCTEEHHHLDYAVPSSLGVIPGAVGKTTKRIRLTSAVTVQSTCHRSSHRHIETIRRPFWASSRVAGGSFAEPEVAQISDWEGWRSHARILKYLPHLSTRCIGLCH